VNEKILFVDDEPAVLDGYKRVLYKEFDIDTATCGEVALARIAYGAEYAVVVSDMRMPGMVLAKKRQTPFASSSPDMRICKVQSMPSTKVVFSVS